MKEKTKSGMPEQAGFSPPMELPKKPAKSINGFVIEDASKSPRWEFQRTLHEGRSEKIADETLDMYMTTCGCLVVFERGRPGGVTHMLTSNLGRNNFKEVEPLFKPGNHILIIHSTDGIKQQLTFIKTLARHLEGLGIPTGSVLIHKSQYYDGLLDMEFKTGVSVTVSAERVRIDYVDRRRSDKIVGSEVVSRR